MIKIITQKKWDAMMRTHERTVSALEKERDEALKKLHKFERGKTGEAVCDEYCEACTNGIRLHVNGYLGPCDYFVCEKSIPCEMFRRKDQYARLED